MTNANDRREWWIAFCTHPDDDFKECYKRYVSATEFNNLIPREVKVHVTELHPGEIVLTRERLREAFKIADDQFDAGQNSDGVLIVLERELFGPGVDVNITATEALNRMNGTGHGG